MKYMRFFKIILLIISVFILLSSCGGKSISCEELLFFSLDYGIDGYKNDGYVFLKSAEEGGAFFISEKTKKTMYGERFLDSLERCEDFAIYVSASSPYEIAIFKCYSRNDTDDIFRMCCERADELKVGLRYGSWEAASRDILISGYKNYVIFLFTDSAERNEDIAQGIEEMIRTQKRVDIQ